MGVISGLVEMDGEDIILRAPEGGGSVSWYGPATDMVRLSPGPEAGQLIDRSATPPVIWEPGGICAICGGGFGPTGLEPCDDPVLDY